MKNAKVCGHPILEHPTLFLLSGKDKPEYCAQCVVNKKLVCFECSSAIYPGHFLVISRSASKSIVSCIHCYGELSRNQRNSFFYYNSMSVTGTLIYKTDNRGVYVYSTSGNPPLCVDNTQNVEITQYIETPSKSDSNSTIDVLEILKNYLRSVGVESTIIRFYGRILYVFKPNRIIYITHITQDGHSSRISIKEKNIPYAEFEPITLDLSDPDFFKVLTNTITNNNLFETDKT